MKFNVNRSAILTSLQSVQAVIPSRPAVPILANIYIKAEDGKLEITATDMDLTVRTVLDAAVSESGVTTLPARHLVGIFRELAGDEVRVEVNDKNVAALVAGATKFHLNGLSESEYPRLPRLSDAKAFSFECGTFRDMLKLVSYAASTDESKPYLMGVFMSLRDGKLTVVASDSRRMALTDHELDFPAGSEVNVIIPSKTVAELQKTLPDSGELRILVGEKQLAFEFGSTLILSKRVEGNFPNFSQVIPTMSNERVSIDRDSFLSALRRASLMVTEAFNAVKMTFSENKVEFFSTVSEIGAAHDSLDCKYAGKELSISFNPFFLMDPLKVLEADEVYLDIVDELSPGVIRSTQNFVYVLMPIRLG